LFQDKDLTEVRKNLGIRTKLFTEKVRSTLNGHPMTDIIVEKIE